MPNWITNSIDAKGLNDLNIFTTDYLGEKIIDFNLIIPEPTSPAKLKLEYLRNEDSGIMPDDEKPWFNWYSWHCDNWGTKWNACDGYVGNGCVEFNTAWSAPIPIFVALSKMLGNEPMEVTYYDEDYDGHHHLTYINGEITEAYDEVLTMNEDGEWEGDD